MTRIYPILLILFGLVRLVDAHNGAGAIAVPVEGITIDGDLSDWPEGMREYPISQLTRAFNDPPQNTDDYQAFFRIAYSEPMQGCNRCSIWYEPRPVKRVKRHRG
jgi:hypothetical protein